MSDILKSLAGVIGLLIRPAAKISAKGLIKLTLLTATKDDDVFLKALAEEILAAIPPPSVE